jgi:hypothetical protein
MRPCLPIALSLRKIRKPAYGPHVPRSKRNPDGAQHNPGLPRGVDAAPDFAALYENPSFSMVCAGNSGIE